MRADSRTGNQQVVRDTWASGLIDRDEAAVWNACYQAGRDFGRIALADTRFLPHETSRVAFVEAGQGRSLRAIEALPECCTGAGGHCRPAGHDR